ncbi:50S ribosomal protein L18e [Candidatus Woesearchaeota archaeon]|nr:50S ribosomal protein L18e [Candidatus Woesearchaeota archaeon]
MVQRTGPQNAQLQQLIQLLKKQASEQKVGLWKRIASDLELPTRQRRLVNLYKISQHTKENEAIIVPGKVLGTGELAHKVNVAAFSFSGSAREKISKAHGACLSIPELIEKNPKGQNVRIIG